MCARGVCREAEKFKACMKGGCDGITDFIFIKKVSAVHVIENIWDDKMTKWFIQDEGKKNAIKKNIFKRKTKGFYFKREYWILRMLSRIYAADHVDMAESRILRRAFCPSNNMWVDSVSMRPVMGKFIIFFFNYTIYYYQFQQISSLNEIIIFFTLFINFSFPVTLLIALLHVTKLVDHQLQMDGNAKVEYTWL